ncbi:Protein of unknown function [Lactobacillus helveticus CIRM-BIA 104]|uniref:Uncharacterized protein n=1 Tax=Lactobacillus helveticus CIRM-BIA 104 TaxID=1226333 RepID=U6FCM7_LACHE|nr:Protein of unknown function [Lactobacillus helveticus CIRM-BIA 104]
MKDLNKFKKDYFDSKNKLLDGGHEGF